MLAVSPARLGWVALALPVFSRNTGKASATRTRPRQNRKPWKSRLPGRGELPLGYSPPREATRGVFSGIFACFPLLAAQRPPTIPDMVRRIILDVDPGIDDAVALCWALLNPELEVVAVTACAGNCAAAQATRNVQAVIEAIDPPRWPRLGAAADPDTGLPTEGRGLYGPDGMGGVTLPLAERQHILPSDKVICDHVRAAPDAITIVCLGPLTNLARAFQRDPELPSLVGRVVMMGGRFPGRATSPPPPNSTSFATPPPPRPSSARPRRKRSSPWT